MGRPEPCVLFSQTFVHPQLDEYVDEVVFVEPIVITACEFLEQNASSSSQVVPLVGATSPPSFALEVFVHCEGETRFRRLCQPFLYSHSSSNVLEVEAVVTNHLVVRGRYRSLTLVIYGNTAEDLGQFNIGFDDGSLNNLVSSSEGRLEDLPLGLHSTNRAIVESLTSLNVLSLPVSMSDISIEVKQFLQLVLKLLELPKLEDRVHKAASMLVMTFCSYVNNDFNRETANQKHKNKDFEELHHIISEGKKGLLEVLQQDLGDEPTMEECSFLEYEVDTVTTKQLVDILNQHLFMDKNFSDIGDNHLKQNKNVIYGLGLALILCSGRESCFHFVNSGGMERLAHAFSHDMKKSSAFMLLLLGVVEQATRHPIGCEGFLGWWPREDENIPSGISEGYNQLLRLFLQKPGHDIASLATYVLHRLRFYEVASRYEFAVLSILGELSAVGRVQSVSTIMLNSAKTQLKKLLKLINLRGPIEDPSLVSRASRSLILGQTEGLLSYKATSNLIGSSNCCFSNWDIDLNLLSLLKDRGFLPLSAALLSSPLLHSESGEILDIFFDIASIIGAILLSFLTCRSGLIFLLQHPELSTTLIDALRGTGGKNKEECVPLRYASVLLAKGFVCSPQEVGMIVEMYLRVVNAIDRLLISTPHSEEFLWVLWELCGLSRSDCGRQALLVLGYFPEAVMILIEALHSVKESEPVATTNGASPSNLAIFHAAAEIFEIIVTDSTASSLDSWIGHAMELHKALHSSSPGSNRKDAPTRLLEWIDAGVVYQKNGAIGLLRYSAVLASGGDAHLTSTSILVSDLTDVDNIVGDASCGSDLNVMDNLGKIVSEKNFDGVNLRDSSVAQLTTAIRILAFISENSTVAAALYDEGAITVIYAILVNCSCMLERSSNSYDYLVDEGTESNSTSDLLLERNREQSFVDLLVPSLVLLINLLQKLLEAKEQHRNTKLMNALLWLHRELSPKLAACAADLSSPYPDSALGFGAVCHLIVSALTFWPVYGWTPGLFHSLLDNVQSASLLALGPKEICSLLCLLNDIFPEEGVWHWRNGMPLLSALRTLAVGTLLGPQKESQVNWYLEPSHLEKLLSQLTPHLDKIAQIIQHYAISSLVVIQDMLRVFIVRVACQRAVSASILLRPIFSCIHEHISDFSSPSEIDAFKVYRYLDFLASILEHPCAKALLLEEGFTGLLRKVLDRCSIAIDSDGNQIEDGKELTKCGFTMFSWCLPVFKSFSLLFGSPSSSLYLRRHDLSAELSSKDCSLIISYLLKFCQVLPVGKELLNCLTSFKELGSCNEGRNALLNSWHDVRIRIDNPESEKAQEINGNYVLDDFEWRKCPLLCCWTKLLRSVHSEDDLSPCAIEAVNALSVGSLFFCMDGRSLNLDAVDAMKFLFGLHGDGDGTLGTSENINSIQEMVKLLSARVSDDDYLAALTIDMQTTLSQALESAKSLLLALCEPNGAVALDNVLSQKGSPLSPTGLMVPSKINYTANGNAEKGDEYMHLGGLAEKFLWECPEITPDRLSQSLHLKRQVSSMDAVGKRVKGENSAADVSSQNAFTRGLVPSTASSGPTRRDAFRQRKPNTSRPPSMHVDDYVARERSVDGVPNSNVIAVQRVGSTGGRPPSIHVDEFMARQRERQNPAVALVGEPSVQVKIAAPVNDTDKEKVNKSKQLKTDLDDDLHGIDIVFDGEESETDDKLPFPQPDDSLQQLAPVIVKQSSPHSIVEETESDVNESSQFPQLGNPLASNVDENAPSEFSSRISVSRPDKLLTREPSVSSDKKIFDQSDDLKNAVPIKTSACFDSVAAASTSGVSASIYNSTPVSSMQLPVDSRMAPQNVYTKNSPQHASGSRGLYDQKVPPNQPPLPPMPPPYTISPVLSQNPEPMPPIQSSSFANSVTEVQADYLSSFGLGPASLVSSLPMSDNKYSRTSISSPSGSTGPHPPLPPTPPPFSSSPYNFPSIKASPSQSSIYTAGTTELPQAMMSPVIDARLGNLSASGGGLTSFTPPPLMPPMGFNRPATIPVTLYGSTGTQQQSENLSFLQNISVAQSSIQSMHHQLQPLQPPLQRPSQPPQHLWPSVQSSQHPEQVAPLQNPIQMQMHQLQMLQQPQMSVMHAHHQAQHQEPSQSRQPQPQQGDAASHSQQDLGMSLQEYFKDPKAIASLLSNKDELCRLLEQHPKLMQMLQERLGQH